MSGLAAAIKLGRLPCEQSAQRVKFEITSTEPFTSARARFILSFSSVKILRPAIFAASASASFSVSPFSTPRRIRKPVPISPTVFESTSTLASVTLCKIAFINYNLNYSLFTSIVPLMSESFEITPRR